MVLPCRSVALHKWKKGWMSGEDKNKGVRCRARHNLQTVLAKKTFFSFRGAANVLQNEEKSSGFTILGAANLS